MRRRSLVAFLLVLALSSREASAGELDARVTVRFASHVPSASAARIASAIRGQLSDAAVMSVDEPGDPPGHATHVVDIDMNESGTLVRFAEVSGRVPATVRIVAHRGEIGASEVGAIVRAYVMASDVRPSPAEGAPEPATEPASPNTEARPRELHGADASREAPHDAAPPLRAEQSAPSRTMREAWRARIGALYTGTTYASELPWQSGVRIEAAYGFPVGLSRTQLYVGATYAFHPSRRIGGDAVSVTMSRHAPALFAGLETGRRSLVWGADVAVGLDDTVRGAARTSAVFAATESSAHVTPTFALRVHGRWYVPEGRGLAIDVAPAVELAPWDRTMVAEGTEALTLLSPTGTRFRLDVGGTFDGF